MTDDRKGDRSGIEQDPAFDEEALIAEFARPDREDEDYQLLLDRVRRREGAGIDQAVEQLRSAAQLLAQHRGVTEDRRDMLGEARSRLEQPVEIDSAGQPLDDVVEPVERLDRIGRATKCLDQSGEHRLERLPRGGAVQGSCLAAAPALDALTSGQCVAEAGSDEMRVERFV